jgi:predicted nucleic acid-binding protein
LTARNIVIDTGALTLFFSGESSVRSYFLDFERGRRNGFVTSVNLSEFYYKTCEKTGEDVARLWYYQCRERLEILETDNELCLLSGKERCHSGGAHNLSLADCFALAATKRLNGTLLTTDPELAKIKGIDVKFFKFD